MFRFEHDHGEPLILPPDLSVMIGRGEQCDLQLNDPAVSRVHCRALATDGRVRLTDAESRWGTYVNGRQINECELQIGDCVTVGETVLRLEFAGDPQQTTLANQAELNRAELERPEHKLVTNEQNTADKNAPSRGVPGASQNPDQVEKRSAPLPDLPPVKKPRKEGASDKKCTVPDNLSVPRSVVEAADFLGRRFLRYQVLRTLATTSSGIVFEANDESSGQVQALKIYHPQFFADDVAAARFERAARTMFEVEHPNIVRLVNAGRKQGYSFTASQLVTGISAVDLIRDRGVAGMLDPDTGLRIAIDLCEALRFAESRAIVHRNIKPSNVLISDADGTALLNDLILAKATNRPDQQLTQAGEVLGDVCYLSPEQLGSEYPVDCRSDIYQLGATLYAVLAGRPPFDGSTVARTIRQVLTVKPAPVRDFHMAIPEPLDTAIQKMLAKNPADRFQSATDLAKALRKIVAMTDQQKVRPREADPKATGWGGALDGLL